MANMDLDELVKNKQQLLNQIKVEDNPVNLKEYYLDKYQEMFSTILSNRSNEITIELSNLDQEIKTLEESITSIDEHISENELIKQKIDEVENQIYQKFSEIEVSRFQMDANKSRIKEESIALFKKYYDVVLHFYHSLDDYREGLISNGELIGEINNLKNQMINECYDIAIKIKENEHSEFKIEQEFKDLEKAKLLENESLIKEKEELERKIINKVETNKSLIIEDLSLKMNHKKTYLQEITKAFDELSIRQLKEFNDLLIKNKLVDKDIALQMVEFDNLFNKFKNQLLTVDTNSNKEIKKAKRLKELKDEKQKQDAIKQKVILLDKKINNLKQTLAVMEQTIIDLDEHLTMIKKQIATFNHQAFLTTIDALEKDIAGKKTLLNIETQELESLQEERTYQLFDPKMDVLEKLDKEIREKEQNLNQLIKAYNESKKAYDDYIKAEDNQTLKKLLEDGKYFEERIPTLKLLKDQLIEKIDSLELTRMDYDNDVITYNDIIMEINELENDHSY